MAKGISDLGNGYGFLYETAIDGATILSVDKNTVDGARNFKRMALANAPVSANRSAVATITVTGCASTGNITQILINGVNQLGAALAVSTSVNATLAAAIAAAINAFTPGSGSKQTAYSIGDVVYVLTPPEYGEALNGQAITVSVSDISITTTTTDFVNGASVEGVYDSSLGRRYYINADYGAAGIVGSATALPTSLTYSFEITEWLTQRGSQTGTPVLNLTISGDILSGTNRYNSKMVYIVETQGGSAADVLAQLNPEDFLEGDEVLIRGYDPTHVVTVESAPVTTSAAPTPNIYLLNDDPFICDDETKALSLVYHYDNARGAHFLEIGRSDTPGGPIDPGSGNGFSLLIGKTLFVSKVGDDALAARQDLKYHYLTINAAMTAALSGDTVVVYPGDYTEAATIGKNGVCLYLMQGATVGCASGVNTITLTSPITFKISGNGKLTCTNAYVINQNDPSSSLVVECDEILGDTGFTNLAVAIFQGDAHITAHKYISAGFCASAVEVRGAGEVVVNAELIDSSTSDTDRQNGACRILGVTGRTGTKNITINGNITGRQYGPSVVCQDNSSAGGILIVNGNVIQNYTSPAAYNTCGVIVSNIGISQEKPNIFINGNVIASAYAAGVVGSNNTGQGRVVINGDIYTENGSCISNTSSGVCIVANGDCYQSGQWTSNNAVLVGYNDSVNYKFQGGRVDIYGRVKTASNVISACRVDVSSGAWSTISGLFMQASQVVASVPATAPGIDTAGAAENLYVGALVTNRDVDMNGGPYIGVTPTVDYNYI